MNLKPESKIVYKIKIIIKYNRVDKIKMIKD